jgi:hypothetical protein
VRLGKQKLAATGMAAALMLFALLQAASSSTGTSVSTIVKVTLKGHPPSNLLTPGVIVFTPKAIKRGTVIFKITNKDGEDHFFSINGALSASINGQGGKGVLKVTFKRQGVYTGSVPDDETSGFAGLLTVR